MPQAQAAAHRLSDLRGKAKPVELDKPRKLMLTTLAWEHLELAYDSMPGALRAWAEMVSGRRKVYHAVRWLWALLQEELHQANQKRPESKHEVLSLDDVRLAIDISNINYYIGQLSAAISAYYPIPDPLKPAAGMESPGTGGGLPSSSKAPTDGVGSGS